MALGGQAVYRSVGVGGASQAVDAGGQKWQTGRGASEWTSNKKTTAHVDSAACSQAIIVIVALQIKFTLLPCLVVGAWCGIVGFCVGLCFVGVSIGTEGDENNEFSSGGGLHSLFLLCGTWCGVKF